MQVSAAWSACARSSSNFKCPLLRINVSWWWTQRTSWADAGKAHTLCPNPYVDITCKSVGGTWFDLLLTVTSTHRIVVSLDLHSITHSATMWDCKGMSALCNSWSKCLAVRQFKSPTCCRTCLCRDREYRRESREVALQKYESRMQRCNATVTFVFGVDEIDDPYKDVGIIGTQFTPSCAHTK